MSASPAQQLAALRIAALRSRSWFVAGPERARAIQAQVEAQWAAAEQTGAVELLDTPTGIAAGVLLEPRAPSNFMPRQQHCHVDLDLDADAEHRARMGWVVDRVAAQLERAGDAFHLVLPAAYRSLLASLLQLDLHIESLFLLGDVPTALARLPGLGPAPAFAAQGLRLDPLDDPAAIPALLAIYADEFARRPENCWFCTRQAYLDHLGELLRAACARAEPNYLLLRAGARVLGCAGYELDDDPEVGHAASLNIVLHPEAQGRGLIKALYARLFAALADRGVARYRGESSNRAILDLGRVLERPLYGFELRQGPGHYPASHFDYPEELGA